MNVSNYTKNAYGITSIAQTIQSAQAASTGATTSTAFAEAMQTQKSVLQGQDVVQISEVSLSESDNYAEAGDLGAKSVALESPKKTSFAEDVLERVKSGESFTDAMLQIKAERYKEYFEEELAKNGGDVKAAAKRAMDRLEAETEVSEDELYAIIQNLSAEYTDAADAAKIKSDLATHDEITKKADGLSAVASELEERIDVAKAPNLETVQEDDTEETALKNQFVDMVTGALPAQDDETLESSAEGLTMKEKLERDHGIKQYEKIAGLLSLQTTETRVM